MLHHLLNKLEQIHGLQVRHLPAGFFVAQDI